MTGRAGAAAPPAGVVAVDIGGTSSKGVAVTVDGSTVHQMTVPMDGRGEAAVQRVEGLVDDLVGRLRAEGARVEGIALVSPGRIDGANGVVRYAANLAWVDVPLASRFRTRYGVSVDLEHDARAGAIAEHRMRSGGRHPDFAFVPIGTGVSAALTADGSVIGGATGSASELGHVIAVPDGDRCACGQLGCVEAYASATMILQRYRRAGGSAASTPEIVRRLDVDPLARQVWDQAVSALASGLASLVTLFDPAEIVLGGGLSLAGSALLEPLRRRLATTLLWRSAPPLVSARAGARSALLGAVLRAHDAAGLSPRFPLLDLARRLERETAPMVGVALDPVS